jgi:acetyltransferase-like isoleucine patch superfamily enzyme
MAYLTEDELKKLGLKKIGKNVKISSKAAIYNPELIEIGDNSRIDDFCILSGRIKIGRNVHITPFCLLAGGEEGIILEDFTTLAYRVTIFTRSDDYSGETLTNSTVPVKYRYNTIKAPVIVKRFSIIGTHSVIFPGVIIEEGTSVGAMSLVNKSTEPWSIYVGIPAKKIKDKSKNLLKQFQEYINEEENV